MTRESGGKNVVWTEKEEWQVITAMCMIERDRPGATVLRLIRQAQTEVLPPERQRVILGQATIRKSFLRRYGRALAEHKNPPAPAALAEFEEAVARVLEIPAVRRRLGLPPLAVVNDVAITLPGTAGQQP